MARETLSGLSADDRAVSLPWWLFGPIPALESTGCWVVPGLGEKVAASRRAQLISSPQN